MKLNNIPIKNIVEKVSNGAKTVSEEVKVKIPTYVEFLKTLANIGKNVSLDVDNGLIKIKEGLINDYLRDASVEDKGVKSIKISCREKNASFFIELKKFLFEGEIELPFTVENFIFNKERRTITLKFGDKKVNTIGGYYSQIIFWFVSSILSIFFGKEEMLKTSFFYSNSFLANSDGTYTIDLNKIPELSDLFKKDKANIKYWDLIEMDKLYFEEGLVILRLSRKLAKVIKTSISFIEVLPAGRLIKPLVNRF